MCKRFESPTQTGVNTHSGYVQVKFAKQQLTDSAIVYQTANPLDERNSCEITYVMGRKKKLWLLVTIPLPPGLPLYPLLSPTKIICETFGIFNSPSQHFKQFTEKSRS